MGKTPRSEASYYEKSKSELILMLMTFLGFSESISGIHCPLSLEWLKDAAIKFFVLPYHSCDIKPF